jgi:beta-galactosidase
MKSKRGNSLDRRDFIKTTGAGLAGLTLLPQLTTDAFGQVSSATSQRRIFPLNHNWLFSDKVVPNGSSPALNDRGFTPVTIPHTNKMLPWHGFDDKDYEFVSLYRRHFSVPPGLNDHRVFIDFGGVMTAAKVSINGHNLGEYRGGYTPFSFELTPHLNWRGENVLAVEVDSTERKDIPPFGGDIDYLTFGGIYRDVALRFVPQSFIENVFAKPVNVMSADRSLEVTCFLDLKSELATPLRLVAGLYDGISIDRFTRGLGYINKIRWSTLCFITSRRFLWWDLDRPKLYDVKVKLFDGTRLTDEYTTRVGFREAKSSLRWIYSSTVSISSSADLIVTRHFHL